MWAAGSSHQNGNESCNLGAVKLAAICGSFYFGLLGAVHTIAGLAHSSWSPFSRGHLFCRVAKLGRMARMSLFEIDTALSHGKMAT